MTGAGRTALVVHPGAELYGSDRVLLESATALVQDGWRVIVQVPGPGPLADALAAAGARVEQATQFVLRKRLLRPRGWPELARTAAAGIRAALRALRRHRPDVVLVNTVTLPLWPVVARLRRVPVAVHVHEGEAQSSRALRRVLYAPLLAADTVVANSRFTRSVIAASYPRVAERAQVVLNPIPGPPVEDPPRPEPADGPRLAYVGRLSPRKGVDLVVAALAELRRAGVPATLDVYGSVFAGYEWFERRLHDQVAHEGLGRAVTFHGFLADVWPALAAADVLVVPSALDESFGNTAVEGVLAGRPVIVAPRPGLLEAVEGYPGAHRLTEDTPQALAAAVADLVVGWDAVRPAAQRSRELALDRHAPRVYRRRLADVLDATARRVAPPRAE